MVDFKKLLRENPKLSDSDYEDNADALAKKQDEDEEAEFKDHETVSGGKDTEDKREVQDFQVHEAEIGRWSSRESNLAAEEEAQFEEDHLGVVREPPEPLFNALLGGAGTGKSFLTRQRAEGNPEVALVSTTGIAAINLGSGTTINALLGYFDTNDLRDQFVKGWLQGRLRKLRGAGIRILKLDEVSMMDKEQLTLICRAMDEVNGVETWADYESMDPEDRSEKMGLHLIGDFCQLPPVKADFAFNSPYWERFEAHTTTLTHIHRQDNKDFIEALRACRVGDGKRALEYFRDRMVDRIDREFDGCTIYAKNDEVDRANLLRLDECPGVPVWYYSARWGSERSEWKQIPLKLDLKQGAKVMILSNEKELDENDHPTGRFLHVNGDLGELVNDDGSNLTAPLDQSDPSNVYVPPLARVKLARNGKTVVVNPVLRQKLKPLEPGRLKELLAQGLGHRVGYEFDPYTKRLSAKWEILGEIRYMPLRLAYASTVHKVQGLSLDRVQVFIGNPFFQNPGSVYVALSRARNPEGLRLVGHPDQFVMRCQADARVKRFQ